MKNWFIKYKIPLLQALSVFIGLFGVVVLITVMGDFSSLDLRGLLFLTATICCVLIAKNIFDTARETIHINQLNESLKENASFASKELYLELYQNSPVPYMIIDQDGIIKSANVAAVRMLGVSQTKVEGINIFERIVSDEQNHIDMLVQKFQSGLPFSDEMVRVVRADKKELWGLMSLFKVSHIFDRHIGLLTLVDITKQKRIEDAKTQFVSLASHQLRTPIAGMKWSAELLQLDNPDKLSDRQKKYIDRLLLSVHRMAVLVDDFLRVSRFELGTFQPEASSFIVRQLFEDIILEQSARAAQKNIVIKTFYDETIETMVSDTNLVRMIVSNILSNAIKYTREKGAVHIGYAKRGDMVHISIADNGMGIPAAEQDRIFSKLYRASNAVRDVPDGTGLGLYIAKEAVDVLDGNISFSSIINRGTTFEIVLPLLMSTGGTLEEAAI